MYGGNRQSRELLSVHQLHRWAVHGVRGLDRCDLYDLSRGHLQPGASELVHEVQPRHSLAGRRDGVRQVQGWHVRVSRKPQLQQLRRRLLQCCPGAELQVSPWQIIYLFICLCTKHFFI